MRKVMKQIGRGRMPDLGALMRQAALTGTAVAPAATDSGDPWQFDSDSLASAVARIPSGASSSPTSAPRATAA